MYFSAHNEDSQGSYKIMWAARARMDFSVCFNCYNHIKHGKCTKWCMQPSTSWIVFTRHLCIRTDIGQFFMKNKWAGQIYQHSLLLHYITIWQSCSYYFQYFAFCSLCFFPSFLFSCLLLVQGRVIESLTSVREFLIEVIKFFFCFSWGTNAQIFD